MNAPIVPEEGKRYLIQNISGGYVCQLISPGYDGSQVTVGSGPGTGNEWRWYFEILDSPKDPNIPDFRCRVKDAWVRYLSSTNIEGEEANEVVTYNFSDTTRKEWRFLWLPKIGKYQVTNISRYNVGTRYLGSNAVTDDVYLGGLQYTDEYLWTILNWP